MGAKLPRKWVPSEHIAVIRRTKIDRHAEWAAKAGIESHFDTWEEAHAHQAKRAAALLARAKRELKSAERFVAKVKTMTKPAPAEVGAA